MELGLGIVAVLAWTPALVLCALLLIFAIKTSRSCKLESLPWLGVYVFLSVVLSLVWPVLIRQAIDSMGMGMGMGMEPVPFGWTVAAFAVLLHYLGAFFSNMAGLVLGIFILSDLVFLLSKSGVAVEGRFLNRLIRVRERGTTWGTVMVLLLFSKLALALVLILLY